VDPVAAVACGAVLVAAVVAAARQLLRARRAEGEAARLREELAAERHAASHDDLTGLPNRRSFYRAGAALVREAARRPLLAILVDLDDFKRVNDTLGHRAGDEVLVNVADRLAAVAGGGLVARLGGDEFVALLDQPPAYGDRLVETADRIAEALSAPVLVTGGWQVAVRASIGFVAVPGAADLDEVLERADAAMYRAKTALPHQRPVPGDGGHWPPVPGDEWFSPGQRRRQVRAVAGEPWPGPEARLTNLLPRPDDPAFSNPLSCRR
jgi:diguanylate cyclase (GGDEF)-like protein